MNTHQNNKKYSLVGWTFLSFAFADCKCKPDWLILNNQLFPNTLALANKEFSQVSTMNHPSVCSSTCRRHLMNVSSPLRTINTLLLNELPQFNGLALQMIWSMLGTFSCLHKDLASDMEQLFQSFAQQVDYTLITCVKFYPQERTFLAPGSSALTVLPNCSQNQYKKLRWLFKFSSSLSSSCLTAPWTLVPSGSGPSLQCSKVRGGWRRCVRVWRRRSTHLTSRLD